MCVEKDKRSVIRGVKLAGYKSISIDMPMDIALERDVNVLIGANGSGKSNFVSFFKMLGYMTTGALQTYVARNGFAHEILFMGAKRTPLLSASLEFVNEEHEDVYGFSLVKSVNDTLIISEESIIWDGKKYELDGGIKESHLSSDDLQHDSEKIAHLILSKCRAFQFHDTSDTANIKNNCALVNNRYLFSDGGNAASMLYLLKTTEDYKNYYEVIRRFVQNVLPQFDDFVLEPQMENDGYIRLNWRRKGISDYIFGPEQLSDGSLRFIALATLLLSPPNILPNVVVIDEPELGLHPQAIDALAGMMRMAGRHAQIIVATQSPRFLDNFEPRNVIVTEMNDGQSSYHHLDEQELEEWLDDYSVSQLWEKNLLGGQP